MIDRPRRLLITDLDNTLWDWFDAWYESFSALVEGLVARSGIDRDILERQIKVVHQKRGTTEYSNLLREVPALVDAATPCDPFEFYGAALHAQNSRRKATTRLYPGVETSLRLLKDAGVRVIAYTESGAYWTEWRIRNTGLDGVIDVLYSSQDHDLIAGIDPADLRTGYYANDSYGLRGTEHRRVPQGTVKPNPALLRAIIDQEEVDPCDAAYMGDSLLKDISMAQAADVLDIHAGYGSVQHREEYNLLRRVTHWTDQDVEREKALVHSDSEVTPTYVCRERFDEALPVFGLSLASAR